MQSRRHFLCWSATTLTLAGLPAGKAIAAASLEAMAVVISSEMQLQNLTLYELKSLYLGGRMLGLDGRYLIPLNRGNSSVERLEFDRVVLRMSSEAAARYWIDRRIRGQSGSPKAIDPSSVMQRVVRKLPGAIGYVLRSEVDSRLHVVRIDGKLPGDEGYPLVASLVLGERIGWERSEMDTSAK
jgi:hypothetical protein